MRKIALINPGKDVSFATQEPLNLGFIAAVLLQHGLEVKIIDELAGDDVYTELMNFQPEIVGITATTPLVLDAYRCAQICRKMNIKTVMGGVHASIMSDEALRYVDAVVIGEGELAMLEIALNGIKQRIIKSTYIKNIDDIPRPAYHLMNMDFYMSTKDRLPYNTSLFFVPRRTRVASLLTSRGCPHACVFCHNSWKGIPFRANSPERVIADIKYLIDRYKIEALFFCDDNFFANKARLKEICIAMEKSKINVSWGCNARVDSIDIDTIRYAKRAGCRQLTFGFESGSQKILDVLNKATTVEQNIQAIEMCNRERILCVGTFMLGNPEETKEDIELTRKFILKNEIDCIGLCNTIPYPGTDLWRWCKAQGFIPEELTWSDFVGDRVPIQVSQYLTPQEIQKYRSRIYFDFALKPKRFLRFLRMTLEHPVESLRKASRIFSVRY